MRVELLVVARRPNELSSREVLQPSPRMMQPLGDRLGMKLGGRTMQMTDDEWLRGTSFALRQPDGSCGRVRMPTARGCQTRVG